MEHMQRHGFEAYENVLGKKKGLNRARRHWDLPRGKTTHRRGTDVPEGHVAGRGGFLLP